MQDVLKAMQEFARANKIPVILDDTRKYLEELCKKLNPRNILEIGMAIGYSGACMLKSCEASLTTMEASVPNITLAKENFEKLGLSARVKIIEGDCMCELPQMNEKFDLIFLDGPKGKYFEMLPMILPLLSENGVFVADNVLFRGMVRDGKEIEFPRFEHTVEELRKFLNALETDERLETQVLHIGDGLAVAKFKNK